MALQDEAFSQDRYEAGVIIATPLPSNIGDHA
jgi:hypothetical protein